MKFFTKKYTSMIIAPIALCFGFANSVNAQETGTYYYFVTCSGTYSISSDRMVWFSKIEEARGNRPSEYEKDQMLDRYFDQVKSLNRNYNPRSCQYYEESSYRQIKNRVSDRESSYSRRGYELHNMWKR